MKRILAVLSVFAAFSLVAVGANAHSSGQQQTEGTWAISVLEEQGGSGFQGTAVLRGGESGTEIVVTLRPPEGLFSFLQPGAEDVGGVAIYQGSCDQPSAQVQFLGQPQRLATEGAGANVYYALGSVPMDLSEVLGGGHVIVVMQGPGGTPTPGTPSPTPQADSLLACAELTSGAMLQGVPMPGDGGMPGGTPTPGATTAVPSPGG